MTFESFIIPLCKNHKTIPKTMERCYFKWATTCVVAVFSLLSLASCINERYEISEENLDLNATIFQEGVSIPLGSTAPIKFADLVSKLDEETANLLKELEGAYLLSMSDTFDMSNDIQEAFSGIGGIKGVSMDESFSFSLSNIDLSSLDFVKAQTIGPEEVDIAGNLKVPDINASLPTLNETLEGISIKLPEVDASDLSLDLSEVIGDFKHTVSVAKLDKVLEVPEALKSSPLYNMEMDYDALRSNPLVQQDGLELPAITSYDFEEYSVRVPLHVVMPSGIKSVKEVNLHERARFEMVMQIHNPLFTSGACSPKLTINLHDHFHIDAIESGKEDGGYWDHLEVNEKLEHHIHDTFVMNADNDWTADHIYHIDYLAISDADWKEENGRLVLDKEVMITLSGSLENTGYKTSISHLETYGSEMMSLSLELKFHDFMIDDVKMEIDPISVSKNLDMQLEVKDIKLPDMVESVDYVVFDQNRPLSINMDAEIPDMCEGLDLSLKTLKIEFPEGIEVAHDPAKDAGDYDPQTRVLVYSDVKLSDGLHENIRISKLNFKPLVNGNLSYSGYVKVSAEAVAQGVASTKAILNAEGDRNLVVSVGVNYEPQLTDYCAHISDYKYDIAIKPIPINEPIGADVAELFNDKPVNVTLKKIDGENPKIVIRFERPEGIDVINIRPNKDEGLKIDFPDMIQFAAGSFNSYRYNAEENSITFLESDEIPSEIVLEITGVKVLPTKEGDSYFIKDLFEVTGGVYLAGTEVHMYDIDEIREKQAKIVFSAEIPDISPAEVGMDEYVIKVTENVPVDGMSVDVPEMIGSISVSQFALKDVYLALNVDASDVAKLVGDATITLTMDITIPNILLVEGVENGVLHVEETLKNGVLDMDPIKIIGLDLSGVKMKDRKITIDPMSIAVDGNVKAQNLSVNMDNLKGQDVNVSISGVLATRDADGKMTENIEIDKIVAKVGVAIDPVETKIDLKDIADALNGENISAVIDLSTFWLSLNVKTNLDVPVNGSVEIIPYYGEEAGAATPLNLELDPEKKGEEGYSIHISNVDPQNPDVIYLPFDIMSILYKKEEGQKPVMASSLLVKLNAGIDGDKECTINPSETFVLSGDYSVGLPIAFGQNFSFEYRDVITDLPKEAGQLLAYGSLGLGGKISNGLPFRLDLQLRLLDSEGNVIPMKEGAGKMTIAPCDPTGKPVTTKIDLVLGGVDKTATDLSSIELVFTVDSKGAAGVPLGPESSLQVALAARIPEGISIDLGGILFETEGTNE